MLCMEIIKTADFYDLLTVLHNNAYLKSKNNQPRIFYIGFSILYKIANTKIIRSWGKKRPLGLRLSTSTSIL